MLIFSGFNIKEKIEMQSFLQIMYQLEKGIFNHGKLCKSRVTYVGITIM